ncbi:hypothetical protein DFQ11_102204 [Winogradskyella epiphytica]|uniref:Adenylosuccinate synthetase n=1 Tax=Winogradskyella epiphytica TaxID=262005 RepID=A0A2V4WWM2_9FLAO|nr:adenylosuccinate synthetase [Winogradskyella epiphytica]PYE81630.1 hypothetical protein DFQ11_102204 [Winogradskyella epiphytica]
MLLHTLYLLSLQSPTGTPNPGSNAPLDFTSPFDIIVFIILPILLIFFYFMWRKQRRNDD